jgi:uncharacterized caspase-like protein
MILIAIWRMNKQSERQCVLIKISAVDLSGLIFQNAGTWFAFGIHGCITAYLIPYLTRLKQAADLHSNRLSQWLVLQHLQHPIKLGASIPWSVTIDRNVISLHSV